MKRITFNTPEEVAAHCLQAECSLVVEYRDENGKQRQISLQGEALQQIGEYYEKPETIAYFKQDKIFYEVVPGWLGT